jgi:hypothetical protein
MCGAPVDLSVEAELPWLRVWARAFGRIFGWEPVLARDQGPQGERLRCTLPRPLDPVDMLGNTGYFSHRPALVARARALGFGWSPEGCILTSPSPWSMNRALDEERPRGGYRLRYVPLDASEFPLGPWLAVYLEGFIPVQQPSEGFLQQRLGPGEGPATAPGAQGLKTTLGSVMHDLTVHALNYSAVPEGTLRWLQETITARLDALGHPWRTDAGAGLRPLARFYDYDLNRYCYEVWARCEAPEAHAGVFLREDNLAQLRHALAVRLDEAEVTLGGGRLVEAQRVPVTFRLP